MTPQSRPAPAVVVVVVDPPLDVDPLDVLAESPDLDPPDVESVLVDSLLVDSLPAGASDFRLEPDFARLSVL